jgi:hypothetical protein
MLKTRFDQVAGFASVCGCVRVTVVESRGLLVLEIPSCWFPTSPSRERFDARAGLLGDEAESGAINEKSSSFKGEPTSEKERAERTLEGPSSKGGVLRYCDDKSKEETPTPTLAGEGVSTPLPVVTAAALENDTAAGSVTKAAATAAPHSAAFADKAAASNAACSTSFAVKADAKYAACSAS